MEFSKNLFDHGKSSQIKLVNTSMDKINNYISEKGFDSFFKDFFVSEILYCFARISEFENVPVWVKDIDDYRMRSEISIFILLFSFLKNDHIFSEEEKVIIDELYIEIKDIGEKRGWDLNMLHLQFLRVMGYPLVNYIATVIYPRYLSLIDYN